MNYPGSGMVHIKSILAAIKSERAAHEVTEAGFPLSLHGATPHNRK